MRAVSLCSWEMGLLVGMEGPGEGSKRLSLGWGHLGQGRCISQGLKGVEEWFWEGWGQRQPSVLGPGNRRKEHDPNF